MANGAVIAVSMATAPTRISEAIAIAQTLSQVVQSCDFDRNGELDGMSPSSVCDTREKPSHDPYANISDKDSNKDKK